MHRHVDEPSEEADLRERRSTVNLERHVQTILISIITGSLIFAASYVYNDNRSKAVQQTQLEVLTAQVIEMRADLRAMQNTYVKSDELRQLEGRVRAVEMNTRQVPDSQFRQR
jgi:hypothetical protein